MAVPPVTMTPALAADADFDTDNLPRANLSYTILYASHFMSNPFTFQGKELRDSLIPSTYYGSSHDHGVNYVSPNDVAEVAVRCLLEPRAHYDKEYTITGPAPITDQQVAGLLSKHLKKPIIYVDQPLRLLNTQIRMNGDPSWMAEDLTALEHVKASGKEEEPSFVSSDFETICGHPPETFEAYLSRTSTMVQVEAPSERELTPLPTTIMA